MRYIFMGRGDGNETGRGYQRRKGSFVLDTYLNNWAADWNLFSEKTLELITKHAEEVERKSETDRFLDCGNASSAWYRVFYHAEVPVRMFSGVYHENLNTEGQIEEEDGGLASPPLSADHVWLEVEGHLLDPTASQFVSKDRPFNRSNYFIEEVYIGPPGGEENIKAWEPYDD